MLSTSCGHIGWLAIMQRVITSHRALQFREFTHHLRHQIGFGEQRTAFSSCLVGTHEHSNLACEFAYACDSLAQCAEFVVIDDLSQIWNSRFELRLLVRVEKESCIG